MLDLKMGRSWLRAGAVYRHGGDSTQRPLRRKSSRSGIAFAGDHDGALLVSDRDLGGLALTGPLRRADLAAVLSAAAVFRGAGQSVLVAAQHHQRRPAVSPVSSHNQRDVGHCDSA